MMGVEHLKIGQQGLISPRLPRLPLERADLPFHFLNDVANAKEIRFGRFQLAERFAFLRFVLCDAGSFFEDGTSIFRTRAENQIDLALLHDGVGAASHPGVGEESLNVAQTARRFVQQVFRIAIAINAPCHTHIVPVHPQLAPAIGERQGNLAESDRFPRIGSVEDDVRHFPAAQGLRRLFTEHPANGVEHIGFSAAVWPDDGRNAFVKFEDRFVRERFKAEEFERLKMHEMDLWAVAPINI